MSIRAASIFTLTVVVGCTPAPLTEAQPESLKTARSKADVVAVATRELKAAGFEVATSDTTAGSVTAKRTRERRGNFDYITCKFAENSLAETNLVSTMTVSVSTTAASGTNSVEISGSVLATYPHLEGTPLPRSESRTDCVSTGVIEKQVATAIGRTP